MTFRNRLKEPNVMMSAGMLSLVIGILCSRFFHPATIFGRNLSHGICGFLIGLSLSLNVGSAIMMRRQRHCGGS